MKAGDGRTEVSPLLFCLLVFKLDTIPDNFAKIHILLLYCIYYHILVFFLSYLIKTHHLHCKNILPLDCLEMLTLKRSRRNSVAWVRLNPLPQNKQIFGKLINWKKKLRIILYSFSNFEDSVSQLTKCWISIAGLLLSNQSTLKSEFKVFSLFFP